jgi:hypothetical protein
MDEIDRNEKAAGTLRSGGLDPHVSINRTHPPAHPISDSGSTFLRALAVFARDGPADGFKLISSRS